MTRDRKKPLVRRQEILDAAVCESIKRGYSHVTRDAVAARAGCSGSTVQHYYKTMDALRRCIMRRAVRNEVMAVIAQGLVVKDKQALRADPALQRRAMDSIAPGPAQ